MFTKIGSQDFFHGHLQDCSESKYQRDLLLDEMVGLSCVVHGVQVETVLLVKVTGLWVWAVSLGNNLCLSDGTQNENGAKLFWSFVWCCYWSGIYSDGCGMDRTAQSCWKMLIAYDEDNAELGEKSVAAKFVIKLVGFIFLKWTYYPENFLPQNSCFHYHQIHVRMRRITCQ